MRFPLVTSLFIAALALACTRSESPAPPSDAVAPATELTSVATADVDEPSCGAPATCGDEEAPARSCGAHADVAPQHAASTVQSSFDAAPAHGEKALCLVMNREFVVDDRTATSVYEGKTYAFCCDGCKQAFDENPAKYVHADVNVKKPGDDVTNTSAPSKS